MSTSHQGLARGALWTLLLLSLAGLTACGGSGGGADPVAAAPTADTPDEGVVIVGLTDAPGDFLAYDVEVVAIRLERPNGVVVETLPEATRVDFAQYVETTEFVTAASVPGGLYSGASLVLDFSDATVVVEDDDGEGVAAIVVDASGDPIGQTEIGVEFSERDQFRIAPGVPAHITLDFDLSASHKVDLAASPVEAALGGVLVADTLLEDPKPRRARWLLVAVDVGGGEFDLAIRPFYHPRGDFGPLTVSTDDETSYEIDGVVFTGTDGLVALADEPAGTALVVHGRLDRDRRSFVAETVLAGDSVPFGTQDVASGTVIARDGDLLTLRGATLVRDDMSVIFNGTLEVSVDPDTTVSQQGAGLVGIGTADVSVGQRVTVVGELTADALLDADHLRVQYTDLGAIAVEVAPLVVELTSVNRRRVGLFDFAGTGIDAVNDADPMRYEIDAGALSLSGIEIGEPTRVRGLVAPFGSAPADFFAKTVAEVSRVLARLRLGWIEGGDPNAVLSLDESGIVLALDASLVGRLHVFLQAGVPRDLLDAGDTLTILPTDTGRGVYSLRQEGRQQVFFDFAGFVAELADRLDGSVTLGSVSGSGDKGDGNVFTPRRLLISLE